MAADPKASLLLLSLTNSHPIEGVVLEDTDHRDGIK